MSTSAETMIARRENEVISELDRIRDQGAADNGVKVERVLRLSVGALRPDSNALQDKPKTTDHLRGRKKLSGVTRSDARSPEDILKAYALSNSGKKLNQGANPTMSGHSIPQEVRSAFYERFKEPKYAAVRYHKAKLGKS